MTGKISSVTTFMRQKRSPCTKRRLRHNDPVGDFPSISGASVTTVVLGLLLATSCRSVNAYVFTTTTAVVGSKTRLRSRALWSEATPAKFRMAAGSSGEGYFDEVTRIISEGLTSAQINLPSRVSQLGANLPELLRNVPPLDTLSKPSFPGLMHASANDLSDGGLLELSSLTDSITSLTSTLEAQVLELSKVLQAGMSATLPLTPDKLDRLTAEAIEAMARATMYLSQAPNALATANPALRPAMDRLEASSIHVTAALGEAWAAGATLLPEELHPIVATLAIGAASTALGAYLAAAREKSRRLADAENAPLPTEYDLPAIMAYYNRRPFTLLSRLVEVAGRLGSLGAKLWLDKKVGDGSGWDRNMNARAAEFLDFVQGAGPAFIKIGQGVSIRPDILPEPYLRELSKLQDRVRNKIGKNRQWNN